MKKRIIKNPNAEQALAVQNFAEAYGDGWIDALARAWQNGTDTSYADGHLLRQVRNQCGPSWLYATRKNGNGA